MTFQDLTTEIQNFVAQCDQDCQGFTAWVKQQGYMSDTELTRERLRKIPDRFMPFLVIAMKELLCNQQPDVEPDRVPGTTRKDNHEF